ncbi:MAG: phosphoribose diphosphate--decaprenyl-phosphate phosphoribosyltransferase [Chloroflexi bacterium GWB2_49_20]|nr:MAG: phosphoribose diphosphate--decaprenyl-phosphate phosphoribosyltransferase [Chloroflexi bacterium GWB2_49_20]OGN79867.1 MAG: phosphoribose diphosphate--decaprenyl-phosphate phosphoribosyltransferase [Chloroflexi bacterium GWC2_49_37]OGN85598.1 MAG: phosphoribose diphosphate--decaprenyl-phosphate phosphoribosyltransferase [Chloroflexi bacterium GWD2_49_16]HBG74476.1 decaprenyl-phosphate phosphoribosyltransferase [Anaerolineae bacterium]HCC79651.1 decaprenyl-phosphate phosphoribosyltransfe
MLSALIKTMRIRQWTKNALVFFALVFDKQLFQPNALLRTAGGFILFCLLSSAVYIFNDLSDIEADRQHPNKKNRPLPSGKLPINLARAAGIFLVILVMPLGYLLSPFFAAVLLAYLLLMLAYSKWLKHIPILDVLIISAGFVLRVHAGVTLITIERFSPWLYVVTTLGALYLGFGKRRAELALLAGNANSHRRVLDGYTVPLLDQYILIVSSTTIVAYSLYTFSAPNLPANHSMMLTIPFVLYGVFRYLYLVQSKHAGGAPEEVLLSDRPLQVTILLWGLAILGVFYL